MTTNLTLQLPKVITARDYHEFDNLTDTLRGLGIKGVKIHEVGCTDDYVAVVYTGNLSDALNDPKIKKKLDGYDFI